MIWWTVWSACVAEAPIEPAVGRLPSFPGVAETVPDALTRMEALDGILHAVIAVDEGAQPAPGTEQGPLYGVPVLIKDNVDVRGLPTTAGSLALADHLPADDAFLVAKLREAGAVLLGKANLSEWANFRSVRSSSGWSATGGQTRNPHVLDRSPCGSSSGSAVAVAAGYVPMAVATETDGSILCPASINGVVGVKPTLGLISRDGIVPIAHSQDTAGPIARTVTDAARLLAVLAAPDPSDPAQAARPADLSLSYVEGLRPDALQGVRLGDARSLGTFSPAVIERFDQAIADLERLGAEVVEVELTLPETMDADEFEILLHEFGPDLERYLQTVDPSLGVRTLDDLIAFNRAHPEELRFFGQDLFEEAASHDPDCTAYAEASQRLSEVGPELEALLDEQGLAALIAPSFGPAWTIDVVNGDHFTGGTSSLTAVSGRPAVTVPMGEVMGLPVGLSLLGRRFDEARLLALAFAYEQGTGHRRDPAFARTLE